MSDTTYILCYWFPVALTVFSLLGVIYVVGMALRRGPPATDDPDDDDGGDDDGGIPPSGSDPDEPDWDAWARGPTHEPDAERVPVLT